MGWLKIAGAVVGGIAVLLVASATLSPRSHVAIVKATFARPPDALWQRITDHAGQPKWRKELKSSRLLPPRDGRNAFAEETDSGSVEYVVDEAEAPRRYVTRIASEGLGFSGRWIFDLAPVADSTGGASVATTLTITEEGEVESFFFRALSPLFSKTGTMEEYLTALAAELGAAAVPEVVRAK